MLVMVCIALAAGMRVLRRSLAGVMLQRTYTPLSRAGQRGIYPDIAGHPVWGEVEL